MNGRYPQTTKKLWTFFAYLLFRNIFSNVFYLHVFLEAHGRTPICGRKKCLNLWNTLEQSLSAKYSKPVSKQKHEAIKIFYGRPSYLCHVAFHVSFALRRTWDFQSVCTKSTRVSTCHVGFHIATWSPITTQPQVFMSHLGPP